MDQPKDLPNYRSAIRLAWDSICAAVNKVSSAEEPRTADECQEKYRKKKSELKVKHAMAKKEKRVTGGGPSKNTPLSNDEYALLASSTNEEELEGIQGGMDTNESNRSSPILSDDPLVSMEVEQVVEDCDNPNTAGEMTTGEKQQPSTDRSVNNSSPIFHLSQ